MRVKVRQACRREDISFPISDPEPSMNRGIFMKIKRLCYHSHRRGGELLPPSSRSHPPSTSS